eukprot:689796-Prorocentrum_minimum.AAC.1
MQLASKVRPTQHAIPPAVGREVKDADAAEKLGAGMKLLEACDGLKAHHVQYAYEVHEELHELADTMQVLIKGSTRT